MGYIANFGDMQTELSRQLNEAGVAFWTTTERQNWINRGVLEVAKLVRCLRRRNTAISTAIGTREYNAGANIADFLDIDYDGGILWGTSRLDMKTIDWLDQNEVGWRGAGNGVPVRYYYWEGLVGLYPTPNAIRVLTVHYIARPAAMTVDADVPFAVNRPDLSILYELPVMYAYMKAMRKEGNFAEEERIKADFYFNIEMAKRTLRRKSDYRPSVRPKVPARLAFSVK